MEYTQFNKVIFIDIVNKNKMFRPLTSTNEQLKYKEYYYNIYYVDSNNKHHQHEYLFKTVIDTIEEPPNNIIKCSSNIYMYDKTEKVNYKIEKKYTEYIFINEFGKLQKKNINNYIILYYDCNGLKQFLSNFKQSEFYILKNLNIEGEQSFKCELFNI